MIIKRVVLCLCWIGLFIAPIQAQTPTQGIKLLSNDTYIGRDVSISYVHLKDKNEWHGGLNIFINRVPREDRLHTYNNRFYADDILEYLGLNIGYTRRLPFSQNHLNPGIYADMDVFWAEVLSFGKAPYHQWTSQGDFIWFIDTIRIDRPVVSLNKSIGISIAPELSERLQFNFSVGIGLATILSNPQKSQIVPWKENTPFVWYLHSTWSIGLTYFLKTKQDKKARTNSHNLFKKIF